MRSLLTVLLMIVFTAVHGLPAPAVSVPGGPAMTAEAHGMMQNMKQPLMENETIVSKAADRSVSTMNCCSSDLTDANPHSGPNCATDCATLLPVTPKLTLLKVARARTGSVATMNAVAPPVADQPPQIV